MTATLARRRPAARTAGSTPATMRTLLLALLGLSLAWGAVGGWAASEHSSAARAVVAVDEPLSLDARQMYESIADADVTITATLLASAQPPLAPLRRYQADIATASADLARLKAAGDAAALAALAGGLPVYASYVAQAQGQYSLGYPLTGGSFLQVASEEAHLVLLPAARTVFTQQNAALTAASGRATGLATIIVALFLALACGITLFLAQRWLTRRTNRVFSAGLALASVLLVIGAVWVAAAFTVARSDLDRGIGQGSRPAQTLAQASIGVQQIRGDAVLNVISRSGDASFQQDFLTTRKLVGPGPGTLLTSAGPGSSVAAAGQEADAWYAANARVYRLGAAADYAAERTLVIGTGAGSSAAGYAALERDISQAIAGDQAVFRSAATAGSRVLDPLEPVVIVTSLLMAFGCFRGFSRRIAEYR